VERIASNEFCDEVISKTIKVFGTIDILVNCAGTITRSVTEEMTSREWRRVEDYAPFDKVLHFSEPVKNKNKDISSIVRSHVAFLSWACKCSKQVVYALTAYLYDKTRINNPYVRIKKQTLKKVKKYKNISLPIVHPVIDLDGGIKRQIYVIAQIPVNSEIYTKFGRLFERFQLVELPQLINIIIGNMSLVGSRPLPKDLNLKLEREFGEEFVKRRMNVLPGLTGISQIMGKNDLTDLQRLEVEVAYSEFKNKSNEMSVVFLNLLIIFETFVVVISRGKVRISTKIILSRLDFDKNFF